LIYVVVFVLIRPLYKSPFDDYMMLKSLNIRDFSHGESKKIVTIQV